MLSRACRQCFCIELGADEIFGIVGWTDRIFAFRHGNICATATDNTAYGARAELAVSQQLLLAQVEGITHRSNVSSAVISIGDRSMHVVGTLPLAKRKEDIFELRNESVLIL